MGFDISNSKGGLLRLGLGLGLRDESLENCMKTDEHKQKNKKKEEDHQAYPSLTLGVGLPHDDDQHQLAVTTNTDQSDEYFHPHAASSPSAVSSFSNSSGIKRERDQFFSGEEELEVEVEVEGEKISSRVVVDVDENGNPKKKLRLTKDQSAVLEDSFKHHSTLNPKQKQELARKLNLRERQVEVWFQNRRARTKLKQTEVECELLKKCCESLREENKRLQKELQELKSMKTMPGGPFYMQLPVASLSICPSCKRISGSGGSRSGSNNINGSSPTTTALLIGPNKAQHHFYTFTQSSAAC